MQRNITRLFILASLFLLNIGYYPSEAVLIRVPTDFPTLQQAIDNAVDGDMIILESDITEAEIDVISKDLVIDGGGNTIYTPSGSYLYTLYLEDSRSILRNLNIVREFTDENNLFIGGESYAIGVYLFSSNVTMENVAVNMMVGYSWSGFPLAPEKTTHVAVRVEYSFLYATSISLTAEVGIEVLNVGGYIDYSRICQTTIDSCDFFPGFITVRGLSHVLEVRESYINASFIGISTVAVPLTDFFWELDVPDLYGWVKVIDSIVEAEIGLYYVTDPHPLYPTIDSLPYTSLMVRDTVVRYWEPDGIDRLRHEALSTGLTLLKSINTSVEISGTVIEGFSTGVLAYIGDTGLNTSLDIVSTEIYVSRDNDWPLTPTRGVAVYLGYSIAPGGIEGGISIDPAPYNDFLNASIIDTVVESLDDAGNVGIVFKEAVAGGGRDDINMVLDSLYSQILDPMPTSGNWMNLTLLNVNVTGFGVGLELTGWTPYEMDVNVHRLYNVEVDIGLHVIFRDKPRQSHDVDVDWLNASSGEVSGPALVEIADDVEDFLVTYSILERVRLESPDQFSITFIENVVDVSHDESLDATMVRNIDLNMIWTLKTLVTNSITGDPIEGVEIVYMRGIEMGRGYTDGSGVYTHPFFYSFGPGGDYYVDDPFIDGLVVIADPGGMDKTVEYMEWFEDPLTIPYWFGYIEIEMESLYIAILGFSHELGTTILSLSPEDGAFIGIYSNIPFRDGSLASLLNNPDIKKTIVRFDVIGYSQYGTAYGIHIKVYYGEGVYRGLILIDRDRGLVWSVGPIKFIGFL